MSVGLTLLNTRSSYFTIVIILATDYLKTLESKFPEGKGLKYLILDSCYDDEDEDEKGAFDSAMERLWDLLDQAPPLPTTKVQQIETESKQLKRKIEEKDQIMNDLMEETRKREEKIEEMMEEGREKEEKIEEMMKKFEKMEEEKRKKEEERRKKEEERFVTSTRQSILCSCFPTKYAWRSKPKR